MKTLLRNSFLFFSFLLVFGCSKDSSSPDPVCYPSKLVMEDGDYSDSVLISYTFDSKRRLDKFQYNSSNDYSAAIELEYNSRGLISKLTETIYQDGEIDESTTITCEYNSSNKLIKCYEDNEPYAELEYNATGQVSKVKELNGTDSYDQFTLEYGNAKSANPIRSTLTMVDGRVPQDYEQLSMTYEYDSKNTPFGELSDFWFLISLRGSDFSNIAKNNLTKRVRTSAGDVYTYLYTYKYNTKGFPTECKVTYNGGNISTTRYEYLCK